MCIYIYVYLTIVACPESFVYTVVFVKLCAHMHAPTQEHVLICAQAEKHM